MRRNMKVITRARYSGFVSGEDFGSNPTDISHVFVVKTTVMCGLGHGLNIHTPVPRSTHPSALHWMVPGKMYRPSC